MPRRGLGSSACASPSSTLALPAACSPAISAASVGQHPQSAGTSLWRRRTSGSSSPPEDSSRSWSEGGTARHRCWQISSGSPGRSSHARPPPPPTPAAPPPLQAGASSCCRRCRRGRWRWPRIGPVCGWTFAWLRTFPRLGISDCLLTAVTPWRPCGSRAKRSCSSSGAVVSSQGPLRRGSWHVPCRCSPTHQLSRKTNPTRT
mmetsp:Transcript_77301/g.196360  ORF Transcript_77301/g.196360 Transcript_77301/m.196360 type:complete len:203 (-) Transcript_77301:104-712(-)